MAAAAVVRTEHEKKFDRQIRLWGVHGQSQLENTHIGVLNSNATASETLKNLCLANIKAFTLVDDACVTEADLGSNFFCESDWLGKSRAECVRDLLLEMNPDVQGFAQNVNVVQLIRSNIEYFSRFQIVIACNVNDKDALSSLAAYLYAHRIPLLVVRSYGLLGYLRIAVAEHNIVETKPDREHNDTLHVHPSQLNVFPELRSVANQVASQLCIGRPAEVAQGSLMVELDSMAHSHVPFALLLAAHVDAFTSQHQRPPTPKDRQFFVDMLNETSRAYLQQQALKTGREPASEQNFAEAVACAYKALNQPEIGDDVQEVLDAARKLELPLPLSHTPQSSLASPMSVSSPESDEASRARVSDSALFWFAARALADFVDSIESGGCLPVCGDIPDMHSDSVSYAALKQIYLSKHAQQSNSIHARALSLLRRSEFSVGLAPEIVTETESRLTALVERVVKNCRSLKAMRMRPLSDEWQADTAMVENINESFIDFEASPSDDDQSEMPVKPAFMHWLLTLRAADLFHAKHGRLPGCSDIGGDAAELQSLAESQLQSLNLDQSVVPECFQELVRWQGAELHNIAAAIGGIAAQEALKLIVQQYVPLNNTLLFDGIYSKINVIEM